MGFLVTGLLLWCLGHLLPRVNPGLGARVGKGPLRASMAVAIGLGLLFIILGFRAAPYVAVWTPPSWAIHLNNLMMLGAVMLFGMGKSKGRARSWLRHPMLTGVIVWALAHLLVNGDVAAILLFGGMLVWAGLEIVVINATSPAWVRPAPGPVSGDLRLGAIGLVLFGGIAAVHTWLGYSPFPG